MKKLLHLFDYVFVLRPTLFLPVWTIFFAGFFVQNKFSLAATNDAVTALNGSTTGLPSFVTVAFALTLLMGAVFILNQIMDRRSDSKNQKLFLVAQGHITPKAAFVEAVTLIVLGLGLGFAFSPGGGLERNVGVQFLAILLVTGVLYSFKPFSWKDRPVLGLVANALGALLIFATGWVVAGPPNSEMLLHAVPYLLSVAAVYLYTTLPDREGDQATDKVTFSVKYGFNATIVAGFVCVLAAATVALVLRDEIVFYPAFFSLPFFLWVLVKKRMEDVFRAIKYPILILAVTISIKFKLELNTWAFFYVLLGVYLVSKVYYKLRFNINYPSLSA